MPETVPFSMRPNPVRQALARGGTAFGMMAFEFFTPGLFPAAERAGADFIVRTWSTAAPGLTR
jgi:hypothetical protein